MKYKEVIKLVAVTIALVAMSATAGQAQNLRWRDIIGIVTAGDLVGVPGIPGGAPWSTQSGGAKVNLSNGQVQFEVKGLVLAAGSASALGITGLPIGTTAGIPRAGTLVCNVGGHRKSLTHRRFHYYGRREISGSSVATYLTYARATLSCVPPSIAGTGGPFDGGDCQRLCSIAERYREPAGRRSPLRRPADRNQPVEDWPDGTRGAEPPRRKRRCL